MAITMLIKYWNYSTNPLWATTDAGSGGWNLTGLVLAVASLYEYKTRPSSLFPSPPTRMEKDKPIAPVKANWLQRAVIIVGLGSGIHMLQTFLMDAGTIIAWTWTGFPVKGPTLHSHAGSVIAASALGAIIFTYRYDSPVFAKLWPLWGLIGAYSLYTYPDWNGFNGGVMLTIYLVSVYPRLLRSASALSPAKTFGNALLVNIVLDVASVVTAAYAFVPMGWLLRERTDLVLGFCMISIAGADYVSGTLKLPDLNRLYPRAVARITLSRRLNLLAALAVAALGVSSSYYKVPTTQPVPYYPEHRIFSGGIWTVSEVVGRARALVVPGRRLIAGALWGRRSGS